MRECSSRVCDVRRVPGDQLHAGTVRGRRRILRTFRVRSDRRADSWSEGLFLILSVRRPGRRQVRRRTRSVGGRDGVLYRFFV